MKKSVLLALCAVVGVLGINRPAEARKIMVDVNQFSVADYNTLNLPGSSARLSCNGIWSVMGNSPGVTTSMWQTIATRISRTHIVSEDLYNNNGDYNLTLSRLGRVDAPMVYKEPNVTLNTAAEVAAASSTHGGRVLLLSRDYTSTNAQQVRNGVADGRVTGVAFELETKPRDGVTSPSANVRNRQIPAGISYVLGKGKKAYVLLSPGQSNLGSGYKAAVQSAVGALKADLGSTWNSGNLYIVLAAYEIDRTQVKFFGAGSVEDALIWLKTQ